MALRPILFFSRNLSANAMQISIGKFLKIRDVSGSKGANQVARKAPKMLSPNGQSA